MTQLTKPLYGAFLLSVVWLLCVGQLNREGILMKKIISNLIKWCAYPLLLAGFMLAVLSGVVINGWSKTEKKIDKLIASIEELTKK